MSRKRDKPYPYRQIPARISKRRRPWAPPSSEHDEIIDKPTTKPPPPPALVVTGLPANCSVLELKSRFEIYGSISRIRIDKDGFGFVSYRTAESAEAAIAGSHEPSFGISIDSKKLLVVWATDPLVKWKEGVTVEEGKDKTTPSLSSSSKLLRPVMPLRKHGRSNRLASTIVNPRSNNVDGGSGIVGSLSPVTRSQGRDMAQHGEFPADGEEQVWSWGAGTDGQLGTAKLQDEHLPQLLSLTSLASISMLACGGAHVIALTSVGKVLTWGRGSSGQLGHGDILYTSLPKPVSFFDDYVITQAAAGWSHSGFVSDSGCLFTCGNGSFGQLGHGDNMSLTTPAKVSYFFNKSVKMVACGMRHSLVLFAGNQVCGFGSGKRGQLGFSSDRAKSVNLPCIVSGLEGVEVVRISANGDHSAAISADGQLFSWGRGFCGSPDVQTPQCLPSSLSFREVALGWNHALLLTVDGEVFKLGNTLDKQPEKQQLQIDSSEALLEKVPDFDEVKVVQIAAGAEHSAAVTESGDVKTWGWGEHGQLGLGNTDDQTNPQLVSLGSIDLLTTDIKVYCGSGFSYAVRRKQELSSPMSS